MSYTRALPWVWKAIEAAALAAILLLLYQARQQAMAVEERVQKLDTRLTDYAVASRQTASSAALHLAGGAAPGDHEALAQRIVVLLRANGSPYPTAAQRASAPEREEAPPAIPEETESRVRQAQHIVVEALSRGKLEREAVVKLRELQSQSGSDPRFATMRNEIIAAINQQKLIPEDAAFVAF